jgi:hypothetical protein
VLSDHGVILHESNSRGIAFNKVNDHVADGRKFVGEFVGHVGVESEWIV